VKGRWLAILVSSLALAASIFAVGCSSAAPESLSSTFLLKTFTVDRIYRSMEGPGRKKTVRLLDAEDPELLWITGFEAVMVGADGHTPRSQQYMCHSNWNLVPGQPGQDAFFDDRLIHGRMFTLSQGQTRISLPAGFGIPMLSTSRYHLYAQVLNLHQKSGSEQVRHKVTVSYKRDRELPQPYEALSVIGLVVMVSLDGPAVFGRSDPSELEKAATCLPGEKATPGNAGHVDRHGREFTGHFRVPPGRHVYRTLVTDRMRLKYDTTIHYIAVHLHPFAESMWLRDLTTDETVYTANAVNFEESTGLEHVDFYSSEKGIPVFKEHQYELGVIYDNTTAEDQDAMAVFNLYTHDKEFDAAAFAPILAAAKSATAR
jgi:hypothetical protein